MSRCSPSPSCRPPAPLWHWTVCHEVTGRGRKQRNSTLRRSTRIEAKMVAASMAFCMLAEASLTTAIFRLFALVFQRDRSSSNLESAIGRSSSTNLTLLRRSVKMRSTSSSPCSWSKNAQHHRSFSSAREPCPGFSWMLGGTLRSTR